MSDHFDQNPNVQAIDARRKAATEAEAAKPKVVHIFTKASYVPPPEPEDEVSDEAVDEASVKLVTSVAKDFESALLRGVALIAYNHAEGCFETHISLPLGLKPQDGVVRMLGALEVLKDALLDIASNHVEVLAQMGSETANALEMAVEDSDEDLDA